MDKSTNDDLLEWIRARVTGWELMSESDMKAVLSDIEDELANHALTNC